jgi:hypothetical protein
VVSRHGEPDCLVLVEPFVRLHDVENPILVVTTYPYWDCMEVVGHWVVADDTANVSNQVESSVNMAR